MVDDRGAPASGTVSLIDRATGATRHVEVGIHPTAIVVDGGRAYVANAMSDSVSEIDLEAGTVARTIPLRWGSLRVLGGMPNALALRGETLYVADGGDNALAEIDLAAGQVRGFRHAGYFPTAVALSPRRQDGLRAQHQGERLGEQDDCSASRATPTTSRARSPSSTWRPTSPARPSWSRGTTGGRPTPAGRR